MNKNIFVVNDVDEFGELERVTDLAIHNRVEIMVEVSDPSKVWIYILDDNGDRLEGGEFDLGAFMNHVLQFYNDNY